MSGEYVDYDGDTPICPYCKDVAMKETDYGYICPACEAFTKWNEQMGKWLWGKPKAERWQEIVTMLTSKG